MSDQLNFEMRLDAAVKVLATNADGPFDATRIAAAALSASRNAGWWTRFTATAQPQAAGMRGQNIRPLLVVMLAIVAIGSIGLGIYGLRGITVGPPSATATPTPVPTDSGSTPSPTGSAPTPSASNFETIPPSWSGRVRSDAVAMPVLAMEKRLCVSPGSIRWEDGLDAETGFVDIIEAAGTGGWGLELASKPPPASELDPNVALIEYGLVFDTDVDGTPDYELGINNSPGGGDFRAWVTDLDQGETVEQVGHPYGARGVGFRHPDEQELSDEVWMLFSFLEGGSPFPADSPFRADQRYYAWSSFSENGSVVAWDYAPDFGWLEQPACESLPAKGWPDTNENAPGLYSWNGSTCAGLNCNVGFMHNGNGSGDVEIRIDVVPERNIDSTNWHDVAGHGTIYRRIDSLREEWIVDMEGPEIRIRLEAQPGTNQADLDEAHAIIESMTYEPQDNDLGFRLIFTLTTDDWDSG